MASRQQTNGYREDVDGIAEAVGDFIDTMGDAVVGRHSGDAPEGVEGSTVAWSDLNPFKRWGRKK
jgi:hypothetical protein